MSIYNGNSVGFKKVTDGYIDYAMETIGRRAVSDLRDGLKPVNRRIIYSSYFSKKRKDYLQGCSMVISDAMEYHPHGDESVYNSFALMTDVNGSNAVPMFKGHGVLGKPYLSDGIAAFRYTEYMCHENMNIYFEDGKREQMHMIPGEKNNLEPEVLNATFPIILVNGSTGIAVAVGSNIPSFNVKDVLDLTEKYLRQGRLLVEQDIIAPDFTTGGVFVRNDTELAKIMEVGKGKLKVRAKVEIQGKSILVKEVPCGTTVESILKKIERAEIREIQDAYNYVGKDSNHLITINCKTKKAVEFVLMELYRRNILQTSFSSNILVLNAGVPKILGVFGIIEEWCAWRESVIREKYQSDLDAIEEELPSLEILMDIIKDRESCEEYAMLSIRQGRKASRDYFDTILEKHGYSDIDPSVAAWLAKECKNVDTLHDGDKFVNRYQALLKQKKLDEFFIDNPKQKILEDIEKLRVQLAPYSERKTEITYKDYKFSRITDTEAIVDDSYCVWTLRSNGFLRKTKDKSYVSDDVIAQFDGRANDVLIGFDNYGQVVRVVGTEVPFTSYNDNGTYLPKYFGYSDVKDYQVLYLGHLDGTTRMLVYKDGYVGFLDTSEWVDKKNVKIVKNGVPLKVVDQLLHVYEEDEIPTYLMVADDSTGKIKIGIAETASIPVRSRRSCAKVFKGTDENIHYLGGFENSYTLNRFIRNPELYLDKLRVVNNLEDIQGDTEEVLQDGSYLDICKDLG